MRTPPRRASRRRAEAGAAPPRYIDVTRPLGPGTPVYPGDPAVGLERIADPGRGDAARVTLLTLGSHAGTHVDAPCHLAGSSGGVETLPPEALIGPALVVDRRGRAVRRADVAGLPRQAPPRILFRNAGPILPSAARALVERGVRLVGTDALSIDRMDDPALPSHTVLLPAGVVVLESLELSGAPEGRYEMIALPLLLPGVDGAPARVMLRRAGGRVRAGGAARARRPG